MNDISREIAEGQLDRVLGFFPRVDAKISFLFAMDSGLLALLAINIHSEDVAHWYVPAAGAGAALLVLASLYFVYRGSFPSLTGGANSLVYFREIARRTEANFVVEAMEVKEDAWTRDILGQVWRNSEILKSKYDSMKIAFILTALSLIPWAAFLGAVAALHAGNLTFK